ncbi:hypothetical protein TNCV_974871 [Trichonephila clavipes]|nr:hypothetical protein TNCV_974871 [Trichonephila clavipes]
MLPVLGKKAVLEWCMEEGLIGSSYVCPKCGKVWERKNGVTCRVTKVLAVDTKWVFLSFFDMTISTGMVFTAFKASWFHKTIRGSMVEVIAVEALGYSSNEGEGGILGVTTSVVTVSIEGGCSTSCSRSEKLLLVSMGSRVEVGEIGLAVFLGKINSSVESLPFCLRF